MVARELAEQDFDRFARIMRIDMDTTGLDENDKRGKTDDKRIFINAVIEGSLTVDAEGVPEFTPVDSDSTDLIRWPRAKGAAYAAMDKKKETAPMSKMFSSMAAITRTSEPTFVNMNMSDLKVCMAIWSLFLG